MLQYIFFWVVFGIVAVASAASRMTPPTSAIIVATFGGQYTMQVERYVILSFLLSNKQLTRVWIQAAINSTSAGSTATATIFIRRGTYSGQVTIPSLKGKLVIYGYTSNDQDYAKNEVILTNSLTASAAGSNDLSATVRIASSYVGVYNVKTVNCYGKGSQALALSGNGNYQGYSSWVDMSYWNNVSLLPSATTTARPTTPTNGGCTQSIYGRCGGAGWGAT
jgi:pectinesterase